MHLLYTINLQPIAGRVNACVQISSIIHFDRSTATPLTNSLAYLFVAQQKKTL